MKRLELLLILLALTLTASAETFKVFPDGSGEYPTIESAIWASSDYDTVLLADGVYTGDGNRDLFNGSRWILIRSQGGDPEQCIIDCQGSPADPHFGIWIDITGSKVDRSRIAFGLDGITITNAYAHSGAAVGISDGACPLIHNCNFIDNTAEHDGGAVNSNESGGIFENCLFLGNQAVTGGAMHLGSYFHLDAIGCTFVGNSADFGGAVFVKRSSWHMYFLNCTLAGNHAATGSHLCLQDTSMPILDNCILAFGEMGEAISCEVGSWASLDCCDLFGNEGGDWTGAIADQFGVDGNISEDPLFCDPITMDYHIAENSPCVAFSPPNEDCDLIGAWQIGCGVTGALSSTWSRVKALYGK